MHKSVYRIGIAALLLVVLLAGQVQAALRLPSVFSDHMVLQQQMLIPVWGWAEPGQKVTVALKAPASGQQVRVHAVQANDAGMWMVKLPAMQATSKAHTLLVKAGDESKTFDNVVVGEVWVCSGQSNMEWPLRAGVVGAAELRKDADRPDIRLFDVPRRPATSPQQDVQAQWAVCSPETVWNFSAVGYIFGRKLNDELDVPIGLIGSNWGGTRVEPWTPREAYTEDSDAPAVIKAYGKWLERSQRQYQQARRGMIPKVEQWLARAKHAAAADKPIPELPAMPPHYLSSHQHPTMLYNGMIEPLAPYAIRGAIWYQGESNRGEAYDYRYTFPAMIEGWRDKWGQGDFPFLFVQLAPYKYGGDAEMLPVVWESQLLTLRKVPHTGMAVTTDVTNLTDIHPRDKKPVGERLARWALAKTYDKQGIVYSGPLYKGHKIEEGKMRIMFDHVDGGLTSRDDKPLTHFQIAGSDKKFVEAAAVIDGETIVVSSPEVEKPVAVRFGWHQLAEPNLMNEAGLPASPFRTDDWPVPTQGNHWNNLKVE